MSTDALAQTVDTLVYQAVFGSDAEKQRARYQIWQLALKNDVVPASINDVYMARGANKLPHNFTVPAMNLRGMTYDLARAMFKAAKDLKVGALICELARSEMGYTAQPPHEYAIVVMAAALRESWSGPLFIQCDHFQAKAASPGVPDEGELDAIKDLISQAISAGMLNIDIDMSTLVDLSKPTEAQQQEPNITYSLEMTQFIREREPQGVTISLGGEIGHIGGKNSTVEDFTAFMDGYTAGLPKGMTGISKISVQTGTSHGGIVMPDGSLKEISVDFSILKKISDVGRDKYGVGGSVQHGASTLPDEFFHKFAESEAVEVHLATGFQNMQLDHPDFPKDLLQKMYVWLDETKAKERKKDQTDEQFHYELRKKAWGKFKQELWDLPEATRSKIRETLSSRFAFMFKQLNVVDTQTMVREIVKPVKIEKTEADFAVLSEKPKDVVGLSD